MNAEMRDAVERLGAYAAHYGGADKDDVAAFYKQLAVWVEELAELREDRDKWKELYARASEHKELRRVACYVFVNSDRSNGRSSYTLDRLDGNYEGAREAVSAAKTLVRAFKEEGWL